VLRTVLSCDFCDATIEDADAADLVAYARRNGWARGKAGGFPARGKEWIDYCPACRRVAEAGPDLTAALVRPRGTAVGNRDDARGD
jgi:hypothetical protein